MDRIETLSANVDLGIAFLDEVKPDWRDSINVNLINLVSPGACILGQVFGNFWTAVRDYGMEEETTIMMGFDIPKDSADNDGDYEILNNIWKARVADSRL